MVTLFLRLTFLPAVFYIAFLLFTTEPASSAEMQFVPNPFEKALDQCGEDVSVLGIDKADRDFYGGDTYRLHYFDVYSDEPLKAPVFIPQLRDRLAASSPSVYGLAAEASTLIGRNIRITLVDEPLAEYLPLCEGEDCLYNALTFANTYFTRPYELDCEYIPDEISKDTCSKLPQSLQSAISIIIYGTYFAQEYRNTAFEDFYGDDPSWLFEQSLKYVAEELADPKPFDTEDQGENEFPKPVLDFTTKYVEDSIDRIDFGYLYTGYMHAAHAVDLAFEKLTELDPDSNIPDMTFKTPLGPIEIGSGDSNTYDSNYVFLRIDTGGDDVYSAGGASSASDCWICIQIDLTGDDRYDSEGSTYPAQGAGIMGYGICIDAAGNDTYKSDAIAQGAGIIGCGALLDLEGDDSYSIDRAGQGSGWFGIGILADYAGNDKYKCFQNSQGFGYTLGSGLLLDESGNDTYVADDSDIRYPSAQSKEHNGSLSQGFGFGKRADISDGHSMAGGVGVLVDGGGNDAYSCGVFGQGCAYWYGVGILADKSGNDSYIGQWYVQGSGAHFAVGILNDGEGNDSYKAPIQMAQGAGHDFSVGILFEEAGNDSYESKRLCMGAGNANGTGIFWDKCGNDSYSGCEGACLGMPQSTKTGGFRDFIRTVGIFIDTGGKDSYPAVFDFCKNDAMWKWSPNGTDYRNPFDIGAGLDSELQIELNPA